MNKLFWCGALAAALACSTTSASAGELNLTIANGRVTLVAQDVTVRQILAEWERVGQTQILNGEKMMGGPITLELKDVPEARALDIVLRSAAGYILAPRLAGQSGGSEFGKIMILATSQPPPVSAAPPPTFNTGQRPIPQQFMPPVPPDNAEEAAPPDMFQQPAMTPVPGELNQPGMQPDPQQMQPGQQMPPGPVTAPQPGPIPMPSAPGSATPGPQFPTQPGVPQPGVPPPNRRPGGDGTVS